jgi:hypothetical protein
MKARPGAWTALAPTAGIPEAGTPTVWESGAGNAWVLWQRAAGANKTYEVAEVGPTGRLVGKAADIFAGHHWGSLSGQPTLVGQASKPLVIFDGLSGVPGPYNAGCVYGALSGTSPWSLQTWSLSNNCTNPVGGAAEGGSGTLAAAWPGGWTTGHGVLYRVGVSSTIPATGSDQHIPLAGPATAFKASVASDVAGNGDFYVGWTRGFSKPARGDGFYVRNVTAGTGVMKAPGTGTNSVNKMSGFGNLAISNTNTHAGVFMSYCSNGSTCTVELWHVGAKRALAVPHSKGGVNPAVSAGPAGRLWVAWYNENNNKVSVTRTNKRDTRFAPVHSYRTHCAEHGLVGLSAGRSSRLDVALQCVNTAKLQLEDFVTQVMVSLTLKPNRVTLHNTSAHRLTITVADAGDPVRGATVTVAGRSAKTNAKGRASITLPRGIKPGHYNIRATARGYRPAGGRVTITT